MNPEYLIETKLNTLFEEVQKELNITAGDIAPEDQVELERLKDELSGLLLLIIDYQQQIKE